MTEATQLRRHWSQLVVGSEGVSQFTAKQETAVEVASSHQGRPTSQPRRKHGRERHFLTGEELERKLQAGQRAKRRIRCRVSGTLLGLGLILGAGSQAASLPRHAFGMGGDCVSWGVMWCFLNVGLCVSIFAPLPYDAALARLVILLNALTIGFQLSWEIYWMDLVRGWRGVLELLGGHRDKPCHVDYTTQAAVYALFCVMFLCMSLVALLQRGPRKVQRMMWITLRTYFAMNLLWEVVLLVLYWVGLACEHCWWAFLWGDAIALFLSSCPCLRDRAQRCLSSFLDRTHAEVAAASIAGLLGNCDTHKVFAQASARFRCIELTNLTKDEMASNEPDPALYQRSVQTKIGECDAFISHSWSDDVAGKWAALQQWRRSFVDEHGREPTIWLDKCCIDQTDIEADLRCLPIFLNGCKEMVVLCGPTYFSRLWCVMELFTHHHIGLASDRLTVLPVLRDGERDKDMNLVHANIEFFDVENCDCGSPKDRAKLMEIILAAFGTKEAFNVALREVLTRTGLMHDDFLDWGSETGSAGYKSDSSSSASSDQA